MLNLHLSTDAILLLEALPVKWPEHQHPHHRLSLLLKIVLLKYFWGSHLAKEIMKTWEHLTQVRKQSVQKYRLGFFIIKK